MTCPLCHTVMHHVGTLDTHQGDEPSPAMYCPKCGVLKLAGASPYLPADARERYPDQVAAALDTV